MSFLQNTLLEQPASTQFANNIISTISNYDKKKAENDETSVCPPETTSIMDFSPQEFAEELYIRYREVFEKVRPEELISSSSTPSLDLFNNFDSDITKLINYELHEAPSRHPNLPTFITHLLNILKHTLDYSNLQAFNSIFLVLEKHCDSPQYKAAFSKLDNQEKNLYTEFKSKAHQKPTDAMMDLPPPCVPLLNYYRKRSKGEAKKGCVAVGDGENQLVNMEYVRVVGEVMVKLLKQQKIPYADDKFRSNPIIYSFLKEQRLKSDSVPLITLTVETLERSHSDSLSADEIVCSDTSPRNKGGAPYSNSIPPKVLTRAFKENVFNEAQFRTDLMNIITEALKEEVPKIKAEISNALSTHQPKATNNGAVGTSTPPPATTGGEPSFSGPIPLTSIKDKKIRSIISKHFPGASLLSWEHHDAEGMINGISETILVDIIQNQSTYFILDVKDKVGIEDISTILRIGRLFHGLYPTLPIGCVVIYSKITKQAGLVADACKIKLLAVEAKK